VWSVVADRDVARIVRGHELSLCSKLVGACRELGIVAASHVPHEAVRAKLRGADRVRECEDVHKDVGRPRVQPPPSRLVDLWIVEVRLAGVHDHCHSSGGFGQLSPAEQNHFSPPQSGEVFLWVCRPAPDPAKELPQHVLVQLQLDEVLPGRPIGALPGVHRLGDKLLDELLHRERYPRSDTRRLELRGGNTVDLHENARNAGNRGVRLRAGGVTAVERDIGAHQ